MKYKHMIEGKFSSRPDRLIAHMEAQREQVTAYIKNIGRCRGLPISGMTVLLRHHPDALEASRKTEHLLVGVYKGDILINMDSQAPNRMAKGWLHTGGFTRETGTAVPGIRREAIYENPRFDLVFLADGGQTYTEVERVILEVDYVARFPDTPTGRDIKHVKELVLVSERGPRAYILLVTQIKGITSFMPNMDTHPAFREALQEASQVGVHIMAYNYTVTKEEPSINQSIEVSIHRNWIH